ncbi:Transglutaminase-like superfamily protein [Burkholderiales bacterium JOSHI_001]|nr:Transglutaminase-like superfamily protein [Burkholderiales bacterium JOSHI_001]
MKRFAISNLAIGVVLLALMLLTASVLRVARPSTEAVRLRNALLFQASTPADFDWTPEQRPADFATDDQVPIQPFGPVVESLGLAKLPDDWSRAQRIASHLTERARWGDAAMSDLAGTYQQIRAGHGYCADFTTVFIAIARSAGMFAREWAFSFDGFGGYGHALVEVFDRQSSQWRMLDVFNNWAPLDARTGQALSVAEFRRRLASDPDSVQVLRLGSGRFGFRDERALWDYYRRGTDQWYLWWGNAVYAYDASAPNRLLGPVSRSLEQLGAVAWGVHPHVRPVPTPTNESMRQRMAQLKSKLLAAGAAGLLLSAVLAWQLASRWRHRATLDASTRPIRHA